MPTRTAQIPCSISEHLYDRIADLNQTELRTAVDNFLHLQPPNPVTREVLIQLRDTHAQIKRNRQITFNVLKSTREEVKALATKEGITMSAVLRRAVYEHTKPAEDDNLLAMYDGWGDVA
jgi:hypothetical protein